MKTPSHNLPPTPDAPGRRRRSPGALRILIALVAGILALMAGRRLAADEKADRTKAIGEKIAAFEYPGSKPYQSNSLERIAQRILITPDDFAKVDGWYREALGIGEAIAAGVSDMPWPTGVLPGEIKGQQQRAVFRDHIRPKEEDGTGIVVRQATTRSYVSRTPERTVVVVINRGPEDKHTMVSVVLLPAERQAK